MGKAARVKREQREAPPLPPQFAFGPQFLAQSSARPADPVALLDIHEFGEVRERLCPECAGEVVYQYGNWHCGGYRSGCGWTTARDRDATDADGLNGGMVTLERCPQCGGTILYNGNYFCEHWRASCDWGLPHPATKKRDRELALRLTGTSS
jgi:hypothetical protein